MKLLLFDQKKFKLKELLDLISGNICMFNEEDDCRF